MIGSFSREIMRANRARPQNATFSDLLGKAWRVLREYEDGGSWSLRTGSVPVRGYLVGGETQELVITPGMWETNRVAAFDKLTQFIRDALELQSAPENTHAYYLGLWRNPDNGNVHVDMNAWVHPDNRDYAIRLGKSRNELSIYDIGNAEVIRLT